jgi:hypothetical protein
MEAIMSNERPTAAGAATEGTAAEGTVPQFDRKQFSQVSYVTGDVAPDGSAVLLRVETERDGRVCLALPTVDLQHLVMLLLLLSGKAAVRGQFAANSETFWTKPLPLHGVSLGVDGDEAVLTVEVGASVLSFSLTAGCMAEIGRTILTPTAPPPAN